MYVPDQVQGRYHPSIPTDAPPSRYTYGLPSRHILFEMMDTPEEAEKLREYAAMVGQRREYLKRERLASTRPAKITDSEGPRDDFREALKLASVEWKCADVMRKKKVVYCFEMIESCDAECALVFTRLVCCATLAAHGPSRLRHL